MTIEANTSVFNYVGDGVTTVFQFPSRFLAAADLLVYVNGTVLSSGYSVAGAGGPNGGTVTITPAPASGAVVFLVRDPAISQLTHFVNGSSVLADTLENTVDKLTMIAQRDRSELIGVQVAAAAEAATRYAADQAEIAARNAAIQAALASVVATPPFSNSILDVPVTVAGVTESLKSHLLHRPTYLLPKFGDRSVVTPSTVYTAPGAEPGHVITEGVDFTDTVQGVMYIAPGAPLGNNVTAVAGYVWNSGGGFGSITQALNGVTLFGVGVSAADNSATWGVNTLLTDWYTRAIGNGLGRWMIGAELDFNTMCAGTQLIGVSVGGNGLEQPTVANAFLVNSLGHKAGNEIRWGTGFWSLPGAANIGVAIGQYYETPHVDAASRSQELWFSSYNADGTTLITSIHTESGFLVVNGVPSGYKLSGGPLLLDGAIYIGPNQVLGARQTGFVPATGTGNRSTFNANATQSISNPPTQAEVVAVMNYVVETRQALKALRDAAATHGWIGA